MSRTKFLTSFTCGSGFQRLFKFPSILLNILIGISKYVPQYIWK